MAPVRVPGTDTFPKLVSDAGRSFSIFRGLKVTSLPDRAIHLRAKEGSLVSRVEA